MYHILGVERTASENKIKTAFRKLALSYHPDKGGDAEKFKEINNAYEILTERRNEYDTWLSQGRIGEEFRGGKKTQKNRGKMYKKTKKSKRKNSKTRKVKSS